MEGSDLVTLFAFLDFLVIGPKANVPSLQHPEFAEYKADILSQLANKLNNQYTAQQIEDSFLEELRRGDTWPTYVFDSIFIDGSSFFSHLSRDETQRIKNRLKEIQLAEMYAPRSRRSRSKSSAIMARHNRYVDVSARGRSTKSKSKNRRTHNREIKALPRRRIIDKVRQEVFSMSRDASAQPISDSPAEERQDFLCNSSEYSVSTMEHTTPDHEIESTIHKSIEGRIGKLTVGLTADTSSIGAQNLAILVELEHYKERCKISEQECEDLKKERRQKESILDSSEDETTTIFKTMNELRRKLNDRTDLVRYFSISDIQRPMSRQHQIFAHFQEMKNCFPTLDLFNDEENPSIKALYGQSADLDDLLSLVFDASAHIDDSDIIPPLQTCEVIQALTGAAIYLWVFRGKYETPSMIVTSLVQKYRDHIATLCGFEKLYDLDAVVHQSIIEERCFKDVAIPHMSDTFTGRLLNALKPLLELQSMNKVKKKLQHRLSQIMHLAVEIRSKTLVINEEYECIWPGIGSSFDAKEMEIYPPGSTDVAKKVKLPLCPGLKAFLKEKKIVSYQGFERTSSLQTNPEYVITALVLGLKNEA